MILTAMLAYWAAAAMDYPSPPGGHIGLQSADLESVPSFETGQPVVGTYFFYWYNDATGEHFLNSDGSDALVDHPISNDGYSYASVDWWMDELRDVTAAGVDFIAPVYWGVPGFDSWSFRGLTPLVEAWDQLDALGQSPPRIGLFYDTSTLRHNPAHQHVDLSTEDGKKWFYHTIRDYFSLIPPRMWAALDGRPIVFLYSAAFAAQQDPGAFPYVYESFERDFACRPYIVKEISWQGDADATYAWGGALGPRWNDVVALGPGYDHHAVPGRQPLVREREEGKFYRGAWEDLLSQHPERRSSVVMVETWNELHEGTDICETREYGRQYIEITAEYATRFRAREQVHRRGAFSDACQVSWDGVSGELGLSLHEVADGLTDTVNVDGVPAVRSRANAHGGRYLYFALDDSFLYDRDVSVKVIITYLDGGCESFQLEYDSSDPNGSVRQGAFKASGKQNVMATAEWKTATFEVADGRFVNRCNGADLRLPVLGGDLTVRHISVQIVEE